jgi:hypothetical protein
LKLVDEEKAVDEFGIDETERLTHFQKPKPPANRRRPRGAPQVGSFYHSFIYFIPLLEPVLHTITG